MDDSPKHAESSSKRPPSEETDSEVASKRAKTSHSTEVPLSEIGGWQAALGSSLADHLEQLSVERNLNARQVKKLLRAILTNEDVVSAFRRYITLNDPETGLLSTTTRKRVRDLGLSAGVELPADENANEASDQMTRGLEPRAITRSLARTIQHSLKEYLPSGGTEAGDMARTILDMDFSDDEANEADDADPSVPLTIDTPPSPGPEQSENERTNVRDMDYHPGPADLHLFRRDQQLDVSICATSLDRTIPVEDDNSHDSINSDTSKSSQNSSNSPREADNSLSLDTVLTLMTTTGEANENAEMSNYPGLLRSQGSVNVTEDVKWDQHVGGEHPVDAVQGDEGVKQVADHRSSLVGLDATDADDDVYAEFLRSLFSGNNSVENSPSKQARYAIDAAASLHVDHTGTVIQPPGLDEDDPDDPEFDVMAELDMVDRDDFFDELRDDRAVRVSKMEAKTLHQDLHELFSDEDDTDGQNTDALTARPRASAVLAMTKSHCHRLLMAGSQRLVTKLEPPSNQEEDGAQNHRSGDGGGEDLPKLYPSNSHGTHAQSIRDRRLAGMEGSVDRTTFDWSQRRVTPSEEVQIRRQIGMHLQLLTTSYVCTYDFPHLNQTVTRPSVSAVRQLVSRRDAFDLIVLHHKAKRHVELPPIHSFYWSCPTLTDALSLITDYAGLNMLPLVSMPPPPGRRANILRCIETTDARQHGPASLPLPYSLIRLMIHNRIWSYPYLMPSALATRPNTRPDTGQLRRRIQFHTAEDALILLGLADFSTSPANQDQQQQQEQASASKQGRYLTYRNVCKNLLPHRNLLQLRTRRWNLLSSQYKQSQLHSNAVPLCTRRLIQIYADVSPQSPLDYNLLHQFANEIAPSAVPHKIAERCGCLTDLTIHQLFSSNGLPRQVGYEVVLLDKMLEKPCRGELTKRIYDSLTEFLEDADYLWWSKTSDAGGGGGSIGKSEDQSTSFAGLNPSANQMVLKPDDTMGSGGGLDGMEGFGPTFFPAIPVDVTPDGNVTLSTKVQPTMVEVGMPTAEGVSQVRRTMQPNSFVESRRHDHHVSGQCKPERNAFFSEHIDTLLAQIRKQPNYQPRTSRRRLSGQLTWRTVKQLYCSSAISGKLPLPRLPSTPNDPVRINIPEKSPSLLKKMPLPRLPLGPNYSKRTTDNSSTSSVTRTAATSSNSTAGRGDSANDLSGMIKIQQYCSSLTDQFHTGLDKMVASYGQLVDGPVRFQPIPSKSTQPTDSSNNGGGSGGGGGLLASVAMEGQQGSSSSASISTPQSDGLTVFSSSCFLNASRFSNRCKARGEASSTDLITLPTSLASQRRSNLDEADVHCARSLLDRCRAYLCPASYGTVVLSLRRISQLILSSNPSCVDPGGIASSHQDVLQLLVVILDQLQMYPTLWEDFVCLLTPEQTRQLGLFPIYSNLIAIGRLQRVLQDLVPKDKRFWRRLRNIGDSLNRERQLDLEKKMAAEDTTATEKAPLTGKASPKRLNLAMSRGKNVRSRKIRLPLSKTWTLLESTWRNRPILMSRMSTLLNVDHKPYAGFEQGFEEIDLLARKPIGRVDDDENATQEANQTDTSGENSSSGPVHAYTNNGDLIDGWEVCTSLSAVARRRDAGSGSIHRLCQCPCHPHSAATANTTGTAAVGFTNPTGKPAKADSLGLRHCIACSLKVHRGIVYTDECNFHLRPVRITWPEDFKPKSDLPPCPTIKGRIPSTTSSTNNYNNNRTPQTTLSGPTHYRSNTAAHGSTGTRALITCLAELHAPPLSSSDPELILPKLEEPSLCTLPDVAHQRVAIEFLPARIKPEPSPPPPPASSYHSQQSMEEEEDEDTDVAAAHHHSDEDEAPESSGSPARGNAPHTHQSPPEPSWSLVDDEAACFNTEAFASNLPSTSSFNHPPSYIDDPVDLWHAEEDRQLLEFSKARGRYSSSMFTDLARCWVCKPTADCGIMRTPEELEARFKQLMRLTLGDAYDLDLFRSPERESSDDEEGEEEVVDDDGAGGADFEQEEQNETEEIEQSDNLE